MALVGEMNYLTIGGNTYEIADAQARSQSGSGTVTSVAVSNASNGGMTINGSPVTTSGTITIGHSNVLTNAQTTQAVYPIKIDKNGHISAYGSAVTIPTVPSSTGSGTTGITISDHGTGSVGSASNWSAGSASSWVFEEVSIPNVTSAGSASTWTFEEKSIPNVTSAGSASSWTFESKSIPNVTAVGSGSASLTFAMDTTDTKKLNISFSHTHTAPTLGTAISVQSKSGGSNGTAPTLGTAIKVQSKSGGGNGTAPTIGTAIKVQSKKSGSNGTAPSLTVTSTTVVTGKTHTVTDNGHTHTI